MLVKVIAIQSRLGCRMTTEQKLHLYRQKADFICFPEYCLIDESVSDFGRAALSIRDDLRYFQGLSADLTTGIIGGSVVEADSEALYNCTYLFHHGDILGKYRKLNPVSGEVRQGIMPGDRVFTADIDEVRVALLICADALNTELFRTLRQKKVDIIFIPTTSPYRPGESLAEKHKRDEEIYLAGARAAGAFVVKTCGVGRLFGKPLQGRTLLAAPWGIQERVDYYSEQKECLLTGLLDIEELREFRSKQERPERRRLRRRHPA